MTPYWLTSHTATADEPSTKNDRHGIALIGNGWRGGAIIGGAARFGDVLSVCDVDSRRSVSAKKRFGGKPVAHGDYRKALDNKDVDVVVIATPDHWHTKIALDALSAGKDIYCEKPLTLTIDEGKKLCKAVKESGRVLQVGTQQRSEYRSMFLKAIAIVQSGRIGKKITATCNIGGKSWGTGCAKARSIPLG
jgi:predicted dehydrogenase